jgi:hypothetical protein
MSRTSCMTEVQAIPVNKLVEMSKGKLLYGAPFKTVVRADMIET